MAWRPPCYSHRKMFAGSGPSRPPPGAVGRAKVEASASSPAPGSLHIGMPHHHHTTLWALQSFPHFCFSLGTLGTCPQWSISALFPWREQECSWGLVGQALCSPSPTWSLQTKGACPKKREGNPPSQGPAPGGPEMLKAHTLASVFLISVFTNLAHTYTNAIFNLQK